MLERALGAGAGTGGSVEVIVGHRGDVGVERFGERVLTGLARRAEPVGVHLDSATNRCTAPIERGGGRDPGAQEDLGGLRLVVRAQLGLLDSLGDRDRWQVLRRCPRGRDLRGLLRCEVRSVPMR